MSDVVVNYLDSLDWLGINSPNEKEIFSMTIQSLEELKVKIPFVRFNIVREVNNPPNLVVNFKELDSAELAFKCAIFMPAEIDMIMGCKNLQIFPTGIIVVESHTTVTLNATVHLMIDTGT